MLTKLDLEVFHEVDAPTVPWIVEGLVARGALTILVGDGGLGKSLFALAAASAVTKGKPIAGMVTYPRGVVIVDAENNEGEIHRRVKRYGLRDHAEIHAANNFDIERDLGSLSAVVAATKTGLLILDSFSSMWSGDENDRLAVQRALDPIRYMAQDHDCGVLLLHHTNKAGNVFRGSGAMKNVPEVMVLMGTGYRGRRDKNHRRRWIRWEKCRMGETPQRIWFEFVDKHVLESQKPTETELWERDL